MNPVKFKFNVFSGFQSAKVKEKATRRKMPFISLKFYKKGKKQKPKTIMSIPRTLSRKQKYELREY